MTTTPETTPRSTKTKEPKVSTTTALNGTSTTARKENTQTIRKGGQKHDTTTETINDKTKVILKRKLSTQCNIIAKTTLIKSNKYYHSKIKFQKYHIFNIIHLCYNNQFLAVKRERESSANPISN